MERYFSQRFHAWEHMPCKTLQQQKLRDAAREAAQVEKQQWINKIVEKYRVAHPKASNAAIERYRAELENPAEICLRGGNRKNAEKLGRPTHYDRVAVKIVSVYALPGAADAPSSAVGGSAGSEGQ